MLSPRSPPHPTAHAPCGRISRRLWLQQVAAFAACGLVGQAQAVALRDVELVHLDGRRVRLLSQVWQDRTALLNFVFTACTSFCGVQSAQLAALQERLRAHMGSALVFISITLDPLTDSPERLKTFAQPFGPGPHWWWLTGDPPRVFGVLEALGADRGPPADHSPFMLLGRPGQMQRIVGFPSLQTLESTVRQRLGA